MSVTEQLEVVKEMIVDSVVKKGMAHDAVADIIRKNHGIQTSSENVRQFCWKYGMYTAIIRPDHWRMLYQTFDASP